MYGHPKLVKQWAKIIKPDPTSLQIEQARIMRAAKHAKRIFQERQISLFPDGEKTARVAPGSA